MKILANKVTIVVIAVVFAMAASLVAVFRYSETRALDYLCYANISEFVDEFSQVGQKPETMLRDIRTRIARMPKDLCRNRHVIVEWSEAEKAMVLKIDGEIRYQKQL